MNISKIIPGPAEVAREGIIVLGGLLLAAFVLSRVPALREFVTGNSLTVKDDGGNVLF
jgi:hypothetical protein